MIRLSVGIEAVEDLCDDLEQALNGLGLMSEYIEHDPQGISVGLVEKKFYTFAEPPQELTLECGARLGPVTLAYETYGTLDPEQTNAILVLHALSGDSHAAGYYRRRRSQTRLVGQYGRAGKRDRYRPLFRHLLQHSGELPGVHRAFLPEPR